jgi:hypothetical protein
MLLLLLGIVHIRAGIAGIPNARAVGSYRFPLKFQRKSYRWGSLWPSLCPCNYPKKGHEWSCESEQKLPWRLRKLEMPGNLNAWWGSQGSQKMKAMFVKTLSTPLPQSLCYVFLEWHLSLKHPKDCPGCGTRISGMQWCHRSLEVLDQIWVS